ncbi:MULTISPECIES: LacI family DNA-binding transcriptional regulator [unclassified Brachybacterium]|uniref:LacI family DNA-binding transcriptional regulator n=1 Tax=unclassified Brachybacterium TaxID=2623841 RepID=UPI0036137080
MTSSARPTLATVARAAGVSSASASMALNDRPGVSAETRRRVLAAARSLRYGRRGRGTGLIGVLPTDLGNPYHTDVIAGIEERTDHEGLEVVIAHGRRDTAHLARGLRRLLDLGVDGVIVVSSWLDPAALEQAAQVVPVVVIGRMQDQVPGVDHVLNHDEAGAALAVHHLVQSGHRRIAHVTLSARPGPALRRTGFLTAMERHGLREGASVIGPVHPDGGIDLLLRAIRRGAEGAATAVFAANDIAAVRVLHRAADLRVPVPERLSVAGYDSSAVALTVRPHLTSVNQPRAEMGRLAAQMIRERLARRTTASFSRVEPTLRVRDSTGPAPR